MKMKRLVPFTLALALCSGRAFGGQELYVTDNVILSQVSHEAPPVQAGEAWVVTNPLDPQQVVAIWLGTSTTGFSPPFPGMPENATTGHCGAGWSSDGGKTWTTKPLQWTEAMIAGHNAGVQSTNPIAPICGDPVAGVGPDGTIFTAAAQVGSPHWTQGITSSDNGWSWTSPTELFGINQYAAQTLANLAPTDLGMGRAYMAVDPIKGDVYVHTQVDVATFGRMITASTDKGETWSTPRPVGSTSAGPFAAVNGLVAVPITVSGTIYFETSTDYGVTWNRKDLSAAVGAGAASPMVAADPGTPGRFAVRLTRSSNHEVWVSTNSGDSWTQTLTITPATGDSFSRPWIAYSNSGNGALGVVRRTHHADGSYDVDVVVSQDGGFNFGPEIRLTAARGPAPSHDLGSDDCACNLHVDDTSVSATWGDATNGQRDLWFGRYYYKK
jgi:hypothetical protein